MIPSRVLLVGLILATVVALGPADEPRGLRVPPREPAEALKTFRTRDGFRMELLAHEPLVTSPVAMAYDENGRAFVLEMRDYPYTDPKNDKPFTENTADLPLGRVRVLDDTDGDGVFDRSTIFADNLSWPTGLAFWKGGIFVASTPDILYLKDTDGDGKADVREKVYTGFRKFNIQAVINNLTWGLDHQIYGAGGTNGGKVTRPDAPQAPPVTLSANDFRFDPVSRRFEALSGGARFGLTFDDWGNRFLCNIRNPAIHVVLPAHYLARNPHVPVARALHDAAEAGDTLPVYRISPSEPWRAVRAERWAAEGQAMPRSELVADGYFTSSSGITIYRGAAYPAAYRGNIFLGEVANNLIHRQVLSPDGVTFTARRAEEKTEFVASTDIWFRPVNFTNAPDGTLHVVDMYRETIEHPWSIPDDLKARLDLQSGRDRGRIYRLTPPGFTVPRPPRLGQATTAELVATLENANAWWRDTAHRLLFERQDQAAVEPLRDLLRTSRSPLARLHALYSLDGLGALRDSDLLVGLRDKVPGVREHAIRLAEPRVLRSPSVFDRILLLVDDPDLRVRFQVAFTVGETVDERATAVLATLARRDGAGPWMRAAILSSSAHRADRLLMALARPPAAPELARALAATVGARQRPAEIDRLLLLIAADPAGPTTRDWTRELVLGLGQGLKSSRTSLARFLETSPDAHRAYLRYLAEAGPGALDAEAPPERRERALQLLSFARFSEVKTTLSAALEARQPPVVQLGAVRVLAGFPEKEVGSMLLAGYRSYSPAVRSEVVEAMLARADRVPLLLDAVEKRIVPASDLPATRKAQLMRHANAAIKERATALFRADAPGPRREVLARYDKALSLPGGSGRGKAVYERECATCHRLRGTGHAVGPDLESVRHHPTGQILVAILDPNREVSPAYLEYVVETKDGKTTTGRISAETATSVTLLRANGATDTILRRDIESLASSGRSLMPEGLEQKITLAEMADLLAYLKAPDPPAGTKDEKARK